MKRWLRRLLYLFLTMVWLIFMSFPVVAFFLATQGQLQLGEDTQNHVRLFLIQESAANGVAVEWARPLRRQPNCSRTTVTYFLWEGEGQNASFCRCYDPLTGDLSPTELQSCEP